MIKFMKKYTRFPLPPFVFSKTHEEMEYESALEKRRNTFFLIRIFIKKPVLKQPDMINCRCSMPDISIEE